MTAAQIIEAVSSAGAALRAVVDGVELDDPHCAVGPGIRRAIRARGAEIGATLAAAPVGGIAIRSEVLGEVFILLDDSAEYRGNAVAYSRAEAASLIGVDEHSLRIIHEFKRRGAVVEERA